MNSNPSSLLKRIRAGQIAGWVFLALDTVGAVIALAVGSTEYAVWFVLLAIGWLLGALAAQSRAWGAAKVLYTIAGIGNFPIGLGAATAGWQMAKAGEEIDRLGGPGAGRAAAAAVAHLSNGVVLVEDLTARLRAEGHGDQAATVLEQRWSSQRCPRCGGQFREYVRFPAVRYCPRCDVAHLAAQAAVGGSSPAV